MGAACCGATQEVNGRFQAKKNLDSAPSDNNRNLAEVLTKKGYDKAKSYDEVIQAYEEKPAMQRMRAKKLLM